MSLMVCKSFRMESFHATSMDSEEHSFFKYTYPVKNKHSTIETGSHDSS